MTVIQMSDQELTRLRIMIDLADGRLTLEAAGGVMGLGRRQVFRLRRAFAADWRFGAGSRKRGRPSNRQHGETFRRTVLALVRRHYPDFGPTLAAEKLVDVARPAPRRRDAAGMDDRGRSVDRPPSQPALPAPAAPRRECLGELVQIEARNTRGSRIAARRARCWPSSMTLPAG